MSTPAWTHAGQARMCAELSSTYNGAATETGSSRKKGEWSASPCSQAQAHLCALMRDMHDMHDMQRIQDMHSMHDMHIMLHTFFKTCTACTT
eukprot:60743-Chlamydomonas_euryale.AAC.1